MIDEKKLIEDIKECYTDEFLAEYGFDKLVEAQPKVDEWIPCSERLPNTNGVYSVTRKLVDGEHEFYISDSSYFDGQDTWHADNRVNHGREYLKDVIAWMPLQKPYKGD